MSKDNKIAICCIAKMENLYLRDFVEYYKRLGADNIILYDNNDENGEYPQQVIGDYISNGFVIYENARGMYRHQLKAYTECYKKYRSKYEWIGFLDVDEYVEIPSRKNIKEWISGSKFSDAGAIALFWISYGDNGLLHYDNRPVYERFLIPQSIGGQYETTCKLFIRCVTDIYVDFIDVNWAITTGNRTLLAKCSNGEVFKGLDFPVFDGAYIKHYCSLTIDEFLCRRFGRQGYADENTDFTKERVMKIFWDINEKTPEKEKIAEDFFKTYKIKEDIVKK